jgi:hypothetical protein
LEKTAGLNRPSGNKPLFCLKLRGSRVKEALRKPQKQAFFLLYQQLNIFQVL